ncbi:MAG: hypothetical protein ACREU3_12980 [Steroidobacteraceae bacterium]
MQDEFERELTRLFGVVIEPLAEPEFRGHVMQRIRRNERQRRLRLALGAAGILAAAALATPWIVAGSVHLAAVLSGLAAAPANLYAQPVAGAAMWIAGLLAAGCAAFWLRRRVR